MWSSRRVVVWLALGASLLLLGLGGGASCGSRAPTSARGHDAAATGRGPRAGELGAGPGAAGAGGPDAAGAGGPGAAGAGGPDAAGAGPVVAPAGGRVVTFADGKKPAREIHVSPKADPNRGDGSRERPYANLRDAVGNARPGTAVVLHEGEYEYYWLQEIYGTAEAPIWLGGAKGEARPRFVDKRAGLHIARARYLVIHDLEISGNPDGGLNIDDEEREDDPQAVHHIVIDNVYIHDIGGTGNQDCLKMSGVNDFVVRSSRFERCGGNSAGSGVDMVGCHRGVLADNELRQTSGSGFQIKGGSEDVLVIGNRIIDGGGRPVNMGGSTSFQYFRPPLSKDRPNFEARNVRVIGNLIVRGITGPAFVGCVECVIANNTIVDPESWAVRILQETLDDEGFRFLPASKGRFVNNLIYYQGKKWKQASNVGPHTAPESFTFANNLWFAHDGDTAPPVLPVTEDHGVVGKDPRLHAPPLDARLCDQASPALGTGVPEPAVLATGRFKKPLPIGAFAGPPCP